MRIEPPSPPYIGPPSKNSGGGNKPINRVVIHSTVSPCELGGARNIANYFKSPSAGGSAHYCVDPGEVIQSAYDSIIAWHAPPNAHSIGVEMCDIPGPVPDDPPWSAAFKAAKRAWRWRRQNQKDMLIRTARLTARLCLAYGVPVQFLSPADLKAGKKGITTHNNVSRAWGQSTHWDPGFWPKRKFMKLVKAEVERLRGRS